MPPIFLVTGWGVGRQPLQPLKDYLTSLGHEVTLIDLPYHHSADQWLRAIANQLPPKSVWVGWSLGGQLLGALLNEFAPQCLGLITLASNPCFTTQKGWACAMATDTFSSFEQSYQQAPDRTIKRFSQLIAQGCTEAKSLVRELQAHSLDHSSAFAQAGLTLLATLDVRETLQGYNGKQLHLLAEADALVPSDCAQALSALVGKEQVVTLANTGHGFPLQIPKQTAQLIHQFIKTLA